MHALTAWLADPRPDRGIYLADPSGWRFVGYPELAAAALRVATALGAAKVRRDDVVCVLMPTGLPALSAIFGAWAAGATICPVVPPAFQPEEEYARHVATLFQQADPVLTITSEELAPLTATALASAGRRGSPWLFREGEKETAPQQPAEVALLQFTSGSSSEPRGVRVSWENLTANLAVLERWADWRDGDALASWLPLHHDMGLIGCLFFPVARQANLWLMRPEQFIRDPGRWLECFTPGRATHSAAPSFAFRYAARRLPAERLSGLDLSHWRTVCVGAEPIDAAALESFLRFAEPAGFSPRTFLPSYGLAENTLAVTSPRRDVPARLLRPDWSRLRLGRPVTIAQQARLGGVPVSPGSGWLIGHGLPEPRDCIAVRIVDENGTTLPEGHLGEIVVSGTSVADGYHAGRQGRSTRFLNGELYTGDAGFLHDSELYVLGRMGDSLTLRGRNVYVEDLDSKVARAAGLDPAKILVVSTMEQGQAGVAVFAEAVPGPWTDNVLRALREELGPEPALAIVTGRRGLIRRTSSGKPRRRHMWQLMQTARVSVDIRSPAHADSDTIRPQDAR
jgi:fatty-acyl-CoA synthase